ncbi:MAG: MBL fold metallo-hydrolase [Pirellulales bacterium]|nr:MBL fold metallo-hydrolase [Pirellulales bacterium]
MKLQFLGAARQVTGSQYYVEADGAKVLVDCGLFQERAYLGRNWEPSPVRARDVDALLLTHAHVDHCGLTPKLVREGFRGPIITTAASADLVELVLRDSAEIQMEDAAYKRRRHRKERRKGKYPEKPLYTVEDVQRTLPLLKPVSYEQNVPLSDDTSVVFHDAGHILGSAMIELRVRDNGEPRRLLFSGDVGQQGKPLVRDPAMPTQADFLVMESTYGDRDHEDRGDIESQLEAVINQTVEAGGNVVVPVFAIERSQELIYHLSRLRLGGRIPPVPVFLDSPMAADVTAVFRRHRECFDLETWQMIANGDAPLRFPGLTMVRTIDESKAINRHKGPAVILATSGMCTAGRIKFHLRQNIIRPECTILFVGYQAHGTLGRQILDGSQEVRIHGRQLWVKARVEQVFGFSGHADRGALMRWLKHFQTPPKRLFLTHGEEEESLTLARHIRQKLGWDVTVPEYQQMVELT